MVTLFPRRPRLLALSLLLLLALSPLAHADSILACVDQVSVDSYSDYLYNYLYTSDGDSRESGAAGYAGAQQNIYNLFSSFGLDTSLQSGSISGTSYTNVVGVHYGTTNPDQIYVIGAHYDSVGNPGADDDASGVAGVLEAARILSQYNSAATIVFVAFDSEEDGLIGSQGYVSSIAGANVMGMVELDMIAYNPAGTYNDYARIYGDSASSAWKSALASALTTYTSLTVSVMGEMDASDHASFEAAGYDSALLIEYNASSNPYYHRPTDSVDTAGYIDTLYATQMTSGVVALMADEAGTFAPEPTTTALMVSALVALGARVRGRRRVNVTVLRFPGS
ncbi:M28 family peptidase [bacterium]|nr:M28 family peptidase [bacterium]